MVVVLSSWLVRCSIRSRTRLRQFRHRRDLQSAPAQGDRNKTCQAQKSGKGDMNGNFSERLAHRVNKPRRRNIRMARIKMAYVGGGSTRAAGTMASFIQQGENFDGSEVVLIDLDAERLRIVQTIAQKMARARGLDLTITATTQRREGLQGCDAVLTSFRPGGFEARYLDESIPLKHGVIGQETQGPGG